MTAVPQLPEAQHLVGAPTELNLAEIEARGFSQARKLATGEVAALKPMLFTVGLFIGFSPTGYRSRFCYPDAVSALKALAEWSGAGDPPGPWIAEKGATRNRPNRQFKGIAIATHAAR